MRIDGSGASLGITPNPRFGADVLRVDVNGAPIGSGVGEDNENWIATANGVTLDASWGSHELENVAFTYLGGRGTEITVSLTNAMQREGMTAIQSVYIDTVDSPGTMQLVSNSSGQRIVVPGGRQGWFPIISPFPLQNAEFQISFFDQLQSTQLIGPAIGVYAAPPAIIGNFYNQVERVDGLVRFAFTDIKMPAGSWSAVNPKIATWIDSSGTIAVGGTFQTCGMPSPLASKQGPIHGWMVQNPVTAVEPLYVYPRNVDNTPSGASYFPGTINRSIQLAPGEIYSETGFPCHQGAARVMAATAGHPYIIKHLK
jgi:hypothetical protein